MQIKSIFTQRLSMVRGVKQRRLKTIIIGFQELNCLCQKIIGVKNCIVIAVVDLLWAALIKLAGGANGLKLLKTIGHALPIGGSMAAHLVQDKDKITAVLRLD